MNRVNTVIGLLLIILLTGNISALGRNQAAGDQAGSLNTEYSDRSDLVFTGTVLKREEIWDRRPNPLMGRPDILEEIHYTVNPQIVHKGKLEKTDSPVIVSVKGRALLLAFRALAKQERGVFYLTGENSPYILIHFNSLFRPDPPAKQHQRIQPRTHIDKRTVKEYYKPGKKYTDNQMEEMLEYPVRFYSKDVFGSRDLQKRITRIIAAKFRMKDVSLVTMVSHTGPRPPKGGYKYWGVKGKIDGTWHIWQFGKLKTGDKLEDPKRYQK